MHACDVFGDLTTTVPGQAIALVRTIMQGKWKPASMSCACLRECMLHMSCSNAARLCSATEVLQHNMSARYGKLHSGMTGVCHTPACRWSHTWPIVIRHDKGYNATALH